MAKRRISSSHRGSRRAGRKVAAFNPTRLKEDVDTYVDAVYAVLALANHARWDDTAKSFRSEVQFGVGRRFNSADGGGGTLTPDAAIQLSDALGIVAEAKPGVSRSRTAWSQNIDQLKKYDADVVGWWTKNEQIKTHNVVALLPLPRVADFIDLIEARIRDGSLTFSRPMVVVGFVKNTSADRTWVLLQSQTTAFGTISDTELKERLRRAVPIDWQLLLTHYKDVRFIDAEPPLPYTLYVLWDMVLTKRAYGRENEKGQNWIALDVDVKSLTEQVQEYFGFRSDGPRSVEIPRQKWIRRALDALVVFGMATRLDESRFRIKYRRYRSKDRDTVAFFGRLQFKFQDRLALASAPKPLLDIAAGTKSDGSDGTGEAGASSAAG